MKDTKSKKCYIQHVTINDRRRENKKVQDVMHGDIPKPELQQMFNAYYRNQVKALYKAVLRSK